MFFFTNKDIGINRFLSFNATQKSLPSLHVVQKGDRIWDDELFGVFYVSNPDRGELVHGEEATSAVTGPRHGSRERRPNLRFAGPDWVRG